MPHELLGEGPLEASAPWGVKFLDPEKLEWVHSGGPITGAVFDPQLLVNDRGDLQWGSVTAPETPSLRTHIAARRRNDPTQQVQRMALWVSLGLLGLLAWVVL